MKTKTAVIVLLSARDNIERLCSLDTDSFICALRRFISRRGIPEKIFCDNGTNFVGAYSELKRSIRQLDSATIHAECLKRDIEWHFNPPTASHMGGVWERLIRVIRKVLAGMFDINCRMSDEMFETVLSEVEAVINGRPITKVSDDPKDENALTPNHLLLLGSGCSFPPGVFCSNDMYRRKWKFVQHLVNCFWKRWIESYVPELHWVSLSPLCIPECWSYN